MHPHPRRFMLIEGPRTSVLSSHGALRDHWCASRRERVCAQRSVEARSRQAHRRRSAGLSPTQLPRVPALRLPAGARHKSQDTTHRPSADRSSPSDGAHSIAPPKKGALLFVYEGDNTKRGERDGAHTCLACHVTAPKTYMRGLVLDADAAAPPSAAGGPLDLAITLGRVRCGIRCTATRSSARTI